jgi:ADP-ribose pyrophosphatase YjhB (NUDIX family)
MEKGEKMAQRTHAAALPVVTVLILDDSGRFLLQKHINRQEWKLPIVWIDEPGASVESIIKERIKEEIGIEIGTLVLQQVYSGEEFFFEKQDGTKVYNVTITYTANVVNVTVPSIAGQAYEYEFFPFYDFPELLEKQHDLILKSFTAGE